MRPKIPIDLERPYPPQSRKAPGAGNAAHADGAEGGPPGRRKLPRALVVSLILHCLLILGASYWALTHAGSAPARAARADMSSESEPFPLTRRTPLPSPTNAAPATTRYFATPRDFHQDMPALSAAQFFTKDLSIEEPKPDTPPAVIPKAADPEPVRVTLNQPAPKPSGGAGKTGGGKRQDSTLPRAKATTRPQRAQAASANPPPGGGHLFEAGQLDGKPRLLHHPSAVFPSELARTGATSGTVVLDVELDEHGAVRVLGMLSATHPSLVAEARRVATGSEFTPPMQGGRPVKAHMKWPITIRR